VESERQRHLDPGGEQVGHSRKLRTAADNHEQEPPTRGRYKGFLGLIP
jgi:hypothetical protein